MRKIVLLAICAMTAAVIGLRFDSAVAETKSCCEAAGENGSCSCESGDDAACGSGCGKKGCGKHGCGKRGCGCRRIDGLNIHFNCGCNGSYKYPVPPLYTYHWPGMYSLDRMTDYRSPWRFPPIKPYTEETPFRDDAAGKEKGGLMHSASYPTPSTAGSDASQRIIGEPESMSAKLQRLSR